MISHNKRKQVVLHRSLIIWLCVAFLAFQISCKDREKAAELSGGPKNQVQSSEKKSVVTPAVENTKDADTPKPEPVGSLGASYEQVVKFAFDLEPYFAWSKGTDEVGVPFLIGKGKQTGTIIFEINGDTSNVESIAFFVATHFAMNTEMAGQHLPAETVNDGLAGLRMAMMQAVPECKDQGCRDWANDWLHSQHGDFDSPVEKKIGEVMISLAWKETPATLALRGGRSDNARFSFYQDNKFLGILLRVSSNTQMNPDDYFKRFHINVNPIKKGQKQESFGDVNFRLKDKKFQLRQRDVSKVAGCLDRQIIDVELLEGTTARWSQHSFEEIQRDWANDCENRSPDLKNVVQSVWTPNDSETIWFIEERDCSVHCNSTLKLYRFDGQDIKLIQQFDGEGLTLEIDPPNLTIYYWPWLHDESRAGLHVWVKRVLKWNAGLFAEIERKQTCVKIDDPPHPENAEYSCDVSSEVAARN